MTMSVTLKSMKLFKAKKRIFATSCVWWMGCWLSCVIACIANAHQINTAVEYAFDCRTTIRNHREWCLRAHHVDCVWNAAEQTCAHFDGCAQITESVLCESTRHCMLEPQQEITSAGETRAYKCVNREKTAQYKEVEARCDLRSEWLHGIREGKGALRAETQFNRSYDWVQYCENLQGDCEWDPTTLWCRPDRNFLASLGMLKVVFSRETHEGARIECSAFGIAQCIAHFKQCTWLQMSISGKQKASSGLCVAGEGPTVSAERLDGFCSECDADYQPGAAIWHRPLSAFQGAEDVGRWTCQSDVTQTSPNPTRLKLCACIASTALARTCKARPEVACRWAFEEAGCKSRSGCHWHGHVCSHNDRPLLMKPHPSPEFRVRIISWRTDFALHLFFLHDRVVQQQQVVSSQPTDELWIGTLVFVAVLEGNWRDLQLPGLQAAFPGMLIVPGVSSHASTQSVFWIFIAFAEKLAGLQLPCDHVSVTENWEAGEMHRMPICLPVFEEVMGKVSRQTTERRGNATITPNSSRSSSITALCPLLLTGIGSSSSPSTFVRAEQGPTAASEGTVTRMDAVYAGAVNWPNLLVCAALDQNIASMSEMYRLTVPWSEAVFSNGVHVTSVCDWSTCISRTQKDLTNTCVNITLDKLHWVSTQDVNHVNMLFEVGIRLDCLNATGCDGQAEPHRSQKSMLQYYAYAVDVQALWIANMHRGIIDGLRFYVNLTVYLDPLLLRNMQAAYLQSRSRLQFIYDGIYTASKWFVRIVEILWAADTLVWFVQVVFTGAVIRIMRVLCGCCPRLCARMVRRQRQERQLPRSETSVVATTMDNRRSRSGTTWLRAEHVKDS